MSAVNSLPATSAVFTGFVHHARLLGGRHAFRYGTTMTAIDLEAAHAAQGLGVGRWFEPMRRGALTRLRRRDHLGDPAVPLRDAVLTRVRTELPDVRIGKVLLLSHLRQLGAGFNPVCFYFCYDAGDETLAAILLEVNNTPWGEQHCYVLDCRGRTSPHEFRVPKQFTVSPFMPLDMEYRFVFELGAERIVVRKENWRDGARWFVAAMVLDRAPLTRTTMARAFVRRPFMTWKVLAGIYFEALRLWLQGVPFLGHQGGQPDRARVGALATAGAYATAPVEATRERSRDNDNERPRQHELEG